MNNDDFTVLVSGALDDFKQACVLCGCAFNMTEQVEQRICIQFCLKLQHSSAETIQMIQKAAAEGGWQLHHDTAPTHTSRLVQTFLAKHQITQVTQPPYSPDLVPRDFWLFPKLTSPLKGKRFQAVVDEIQENVMGQLMATGGTV